MFDLHVSEKRLRLPPGDPEEEASHQFLLKDIYFNMLTLRPTYAQINDLQEKNSALESFLIQLKNSSPEERDAFLERALVNDGLVDLPRSQGQEGNQDRQQQTRSRLFSEATSTAERVRKGDRTPPPRTSRESLGSLDDSSDEELDVAPFISVDEAGKPSIFGPSSALHIPAKNENALGQAKRSLTMEHIKNGLIANAALQRQSEHHLALLPEIDGVPTELAMHLLDLHWSRQHHTFLLTYRPAVMRDLLQSGPNCSRFLLNAIFACASKFSGRIEVRDDPIDPVTAGRRFFRRCDELLAQDLLLIRPTVPTVVGLLLLGSTYNARGETSKGWLYTGYALRMVYDLGLHLDPKETNDDTEQVEIRRRVFWGAFVCDKLQSLYLGRPVAINLKDSHVSRDFLDTIEERELYFPYMDPKYSNNNRSGTFSRPTPIYSVSTFQQLCLLSKIMTKIINSFYVVGASFRNAQASLQLVDSALQAWKQNLPKELDYEPWQPQRDMVPYPAPNLMNLHGLYHSLIILLHRPFISDGHLRSSAAPASSWKRCTAAARSITSISLAYKSAYGLAGAPYLLSYTIYVACTIHVRNSAAEVTNGHTREHSSLLAASLKCLDELCQANPGVAKPASIIRRLMNANKLDLNLGKND